MAVIEGATTTPREQSGGTSPGQLARRRLRRDRVGMASAVIVAVVVLASVLAPVICPLLGVDTQRNVGLLSIDNVGFPSGRFGGVSLGHPLGVEPKTGRDLLALLLYGSRTSLIIAFGSTAASLLVGVVLGLVAGYFGGWTDAVISRSMEVLLAFPVFLFSLALLAVVGSVDRIGFLSGNGLRMVVLIIVIGFFSAPYTARLLRGQVISLRGRDYIGAAVLMGSPHGRILRREIFPNLVAPIIVLASVSIPASVLAEAGLSFLGVGIAPPATSWGQLLGAASQVFVVDPTYMAIPGAVMVVTVLAFNLLGDSVRDAFDPRSV